MIAWALAIIMFLFLLILGWVLFVAKPPEMPSPVELDAMACSQMREQGWTEEEIKAYMDESGGYYDRD